MKILWRNDVERLLRIFKLAAVRKRLATRRGGLAANM
jgi:hypothetical protein